MEIEIYLNFIGKVELPAQELTEEELAEIKEKQRLLSAMPCIRGGAGQSSCQKQKQSVQRCRRLRKRSFGECECKAEKLLMADNDTHIAEVVAGETKYMLIPGFPNSRRGKRKICNLRKRGFYYDRENQRI